MPAGWSEELRPLGTFCTRVPSELVDSPVRLYTFCSWVGRLRGERKPFEESPDTTGQGRWVTPTRGNPQESATEIHGR